MCGYNRPTYTNNKIISGSEDVEYSESIQYNVFQDLYKTFIKIHEPVWRLIIYIYIMLYTLIIFLIVNYDQLIKYT